MSLIVKNDLFKAREEVLMATVTGSEQEMELWAELFSQSKENLPVQVWEKVYVPRMVKLAKKLAKVTEDTSSRVCYEMAKLCLRVNTHLPKSGEVVDRVDVVQRVEMFLLAIIQDNN